MNAETVHTIDLGDDVVLIITVWNGVADIRLDGRKAGRLFVLPSSSNRVELTAEKNLPNVVESRLI